MKNDEGDFKRAAPSVHWKAPTLLKVLWPIIMVNIDGFFIPAAASIRGPYIPFCTSRADTGPL